MVMTFTPAPVAKATGGSSNVSVSDTVKQEVQEAWDWFNANPGAHLYTEPFADDTARKAWERQAKAHAATLGLRFRVVRDDAQAELNEKTGKPVVRFHIETEEAWQARQDEKAAKAADLAARKAAGEVIKPGRKAGK